MQYIDYGLGPGLDSDLVSHIGDRVCEGQTGVVGCEDALVGA